MNQYVKIIGCTLSLGVSLSYAKSRSIKSQEEFDQVKQTQSPIAAYFHADYCSPCQAAKEHYRRISAMPEYQDIAFLMIDILAHPRITEEYGVRGIPTIVFIKDGTEVNRMTGFRDAQTFNAELIRSLNSAFNKEASGMQATESEDQTAINMPAESSPESAPGFLTRIYHEILWFICQILFMLASLFHWIGSLFQSPCS
jgi:thiol-disulfide isomerase/thioredoxin